MPSKIFALIFFTFLSLRFHPSESKTRMKAGYWLSGKDLPISDINSALFTHLICGFAGINSSTYELSILSTDERNFSIFTDTVKQKNPTITTLLSIGGGIVKASTFSSMTSSSVRRSSFIDFSIKIARLYGFHGLDLNWVWPSTSSDMTNMGNLFQEWRAATEFEAKSSRQTQLILSVAAHYSPDLESVSFPVESMQRNLNWLYIVAYDYYSPLITNFTAAHAALYDPASQINTDYGIRTWIARGVSADKLVLGLPFYGYAWMLKNSQENVIGAPATGLVITGQGDQIAYRDIRGYIQRYGAALTYNATYVVNYCTNGSTWIAFDDVEAIKSKVSYAKEIRLLGYHVWRVSYDDNWMLSLAAAQELDSNQHQKWRLLVIILATVASGITFLLGLVIFHFRKRKLKSKVKEGRLKNIISAAENFNSINIPADLQVFSYAAIDAATDKFSFENKLGEGGFGPVYKGILANGQEIAVKKLSKASKQGFEEFKNEVSLTAKLQHVNLVRVLGYCIERDEKILIYEFMPNKSLDSYIFDNARRFLLDWKKRAHIIEGITQGLVYLQEYSRLTIIHRDLKAGNILLDNEMKPKISDFGIAKIFSKDIGHEANTGRIAGTYGFVSPEYARKGLYSTKSDVYSFGVLFLQIISGKKNICCYGLQENLNLLEYAYDLWESGEGMRFMDPSLDDSLSSWKLIRCLQIALLCVQENAIDRPSMLEVSSMLKAAHIALKIPKIPAFSTKGNGDDQKISNLQPESSSVNDTTFSQVVGR